MSLEEAIARRRSVRHYAAEPLSHSHLSQMLWAAQGITDPSLELGLPPVLALFSLWRHTSS